MRKTLYLELIVNGELYNTIDMYDATEDYENAYQCASEELEWCNNQEWFECHVEGDLTPEDCIWRLRITELEH